MIMSHVRGAAPSTSRRCSPSASSLALVLRAIFIALGAALLAAFSFMFLIFGLLLVFTAIQLFRHRDEDPDIEDNALVRDHAAASCPSPTSTTAAGCVTRVDGRRVLTPLFIVLIAIGSTDLLFALDSIPAVFGVTEEAYIVFAANAFALLGLRALFFLVTGLLDRLVYLSTGLVADPRVHRRQADAALGAPAGRRVPEIATSTSLVVIVVDAARHHRGQPAQVAPRPEARAHAGSLRDRRARPLLRRRGDACPSASAGAETTARGSARRPPRRDADPTAVTPRAPVRPVAARTRRAPARRRGWVSR